MENENNNLAAPLAGSNNADDESVGFLNPVQRQLMEYRNSRRTNSQKSVDVSSTPNSNYAPPLL